MVLTSIAILFLAINGILLADLFHKHEERLNRLEKMFDKQIELDDTLNKKINDVNERLCKKEKE